MLGVSDGLLDVERLHRLRGLARLVARQAAALELDDRVLHLVCGQLCGLVACLSTPPLRDDSTPAEVVAGGRRRRPSRRLNEAEEDGE